MKEYLKRKMEQYLSNMLSEEKASYYCTEKDLHKDVLDGFYEWLLLEPDFHK